ncbi:MAG: sugar ABC transporter permease [Roseovarius sp.]
MRGERTLYSILGVAVLLTGLLILYPAYHALELSFQKLDSFVSEPEWVGFANYGTVLRLPEFWAAFGRGIVFALSTITLQVVFGIAFAMLLNAQIPLKPLVRGITVLPYLLPTIIVALTFQWMLDPTNGVMSDAVGLFGMDYIPWGENGAVAMSLVIFLSVWIWTPFVTLAFLAGLQSVPDELYEAARVDGATAWQRFWHITLPQLRPVLTVVVLLRAIWMFNKFDIIWLTTRGGPLEATEHLPVLAYRKTFEMYQLGEGAAVSAISFLILSVFIFVYFYFFPLDEKGS